VHRVGVQPAARSRVGHLRLHGGHTLNPSYKDICNGDTGHAEVVQVTFDPAEISYRDLLKYSSPCTTPPAQPSGQRRRHAIRSAIFCHSPEQQAEAEAVIAELTAANNSVRPS